MALAQVHLRHNLDAILKEGDSQIDTSSDNLMEQLQGGICLNQSKLISARSLSIVWGDDSRYWKWTCRPNTKDHCRPVEVAELLNVCWLDVSKKFPATNLTPRTVYQVSFVLMMKDGEYGFANHPVNFKLE
ncbi:hypothetical protein Patl1_11854 [Pistacia atlantica]|uniref:Uncharacterized protein n=1 Tax=Pistacia atlantica TaxID=434234 RepID=A0ACC1A4W7_9ROSI|nr:hypothetical protein Patl1_11854 [Pistacia atlantica]